MDTLISKLLALKWFSAIKANTAPRWLVLIVDLVIISCSYFLLATSEAFVPGHTVSTLIFLRNWAMVLVVYLLMILLTKSYTSVIRLSVFEDLYREFLVVSLSTILLLVLNALLAASTGEDLARSWNIVIIGAISFSFLVMERLLIKHVYSVLKQYDSSERQRVLVLGTSLESIILANALKSEIGGKYYPIGLLAEKGTNPPTQISGFKVFPYDENTLVNTFVENSIHALIFNHDKVKLVGREYADFFINNNLRILSLNHVEEFSGDENGDENSANISTHVKNVQIEDFLGRDPIVLDNSLVRSNIRGSVVMITGACGSIGSEIVRQVATYKAKKIILVDQAETPMHDMALEMKEKFPEADIVLFMGDVQNRDRMERAFAEYRPRFVFHAAAYKHVPMMEINPSEAVLTNVMGSKNIADLALKYDVYKFVMISTDKAVNPTNVMGCSKRICEIYVQSLDKAIKDGKVKGVTQFVTTRFGNVLGSNGSVIPLFRKQLAAGGPLTVTHPKIIRFFMLIPEACKLVLEAGTHGKGGEIFVFDMGEPVRIADLAKRMILLSGAKNVEIKYTGLREGEKLYEEVLNENENTLPSFHKKIRIAMVRSYEYEEAERELEELRDIASKYDDMETVRKMKEIVPEYVSKHSRYEVLDKKD